MLTVIILKRKLCIQWRLYICNVTIQIPTKLKKIGSTGRNSMREENKSEKIWPLNLEGPQNYSSNERVKTLHMYSFYKNTLTFNCCFSNLSLLCFSWENAAGHISRGCGVGWGRMTTCVEPVHLEDTGQWWPLHPQFHLLLFFCFPLERTSQKSFGVHFKFNKILCLG